MKQVFIRSVVIVILIVCAGGCRKDTKPIVTGETVEVTTETIGPEGGTIAVSKPGDPVDGLIIEVPAGAYDETLTFDISYRPVVDHILGNKFNPLTPLISVKNGGLCANEIMTITIPVVIPEDHFAMAFFYDEITGEFEGMPLGEQTVNSITFATRHFSEFIVSSIAKGLLELELDSGFKHGVDDWQFTNYGSWIASRGHCSGQCLTALYYYVKKKLKEGKPQLYGTYDNDGNTAHKTPTLQWDDELAYKWCSVAQVTLRIDEKLQQFEQKQKGNPVYTYYCFSYALLLTEKPQYAGVFRVENEGTADQKKIGHALIVYKKSEILTRNGRKVIIFHISDPNYPYKTEQEKNEKELVFDYENGVFEPYSSGENASNLGKQFPGICYAGENALINSSKQDDLWQEFENGTIGTDEFPAYSIRVVDNTMEVTLYDGYETTTDSIDIKLCSNAFLFDQRLTIYNEAGEKLGTYDLAQPDDECLRTTVKNLKQGNNLLGFHVEGAIYSTENGKRWGYAGFDWITIVRKEAQHTERFSQFKSGYIHVNAVKSMCLDTYGEPFETEYHYTRWDATGTFSGNTFTGTYTVTEDPAYNNYNANGTLVAVVDIDSSDNILELKSFAAEMTLTSPAYSPNPSTVITKISGQNVPLKSEFGWLEFEAEEDKTCECITLLESETESKSSDASDPYWSKCAGEPVCDDVSSVYISFSPE